MNELNIYDVDLKYIRDLHNADSNVMSQSPQINKETRRYIGIILMINGQPYCIPFSSGNKEKFQNKKSNIDLLKIPDEEHKTSTGAFKTLAVLNINNMIPVSKSVIAKVDLHILDSDSINVRRHKALLQKELKWCRNNYDLIERRARKVYSQVVEFPEKSRNLTRRCCNFRKLEEVLSKRLEKESSSKPDAADIIKEMDTWAQAVNDNAQRDLNNKDRQER